MSHISGAVYTVWSILTTIYFCFLISHLWKFDRFESLKWRSKGAGAFKRVMTFTYLLGLPCIMIFSIGMTTIKYREGYSEIPPFGIIPTPFQLWSKLDQSLLIKFEMIFAVSWGLEVVTHLEELCFWLFLVNVGPSHSSWFGSIFFKIWAVGSLLGIIGIPLVTWFTRHNPTICEAWTFLAGSAASLLITLGGLRVLWVFPRFLSTVKSAGGEPEVVIRLTAFHDLNITRVIFRFVFTVPLFVLAIDGVQGHHHVNESSLWTDLLAIMGGIGLVVSSCITLLIFFPRSIEREAGYRPRKSSGRGATGGEEISLQPINPSAAAQQQQRTTGFRSALPADDNPFAASTGPTSQTGRHNDDGDLYGQKGGQLVDDEDEIHYPPPTQTNDGMPPGYGQRPNVYRYGSDPKRQEVWEMVSGPGESGMTAGGATEYPRPPANGVVNVSFGEYPSTGFAPTRPPRRDVHPMLMNYSSPINFGTDYEAGPSRSRTMPRNAI